MTRSWRVPMIVTSHFPTYESIILSKNLNNKKKLTGWVTPTVYCILFICKFWKKSWNVPTTVDDGKNSLGKKNQFMDPFSKVTHGTGQPLFSSF